MKPVHESSSHNSENSNNQKSSDDEDSLRVSSGKSKHDSSERITADPTLRVDDKRTVDNSKATASLSSSSSYSSVEELFEVDAKLTPVSSKTDIEFQNIEAPKPVELSPAATSSPSQHPATQVMERTASHDPHRLPSSIFARNSSNSMRWSMTSNDSLFSLNFGNNSTRDNLLVFEDSQNGEYFKPEEQHRHHESDEMYWFGQPRPLPLVEENGSSDDEKDEVSKKSEGKTSREESVHGKSDAKVQSPYSSSTSYSPSVRIQPDSSGTSSSKPDAKSRKKKWPWGFCPCSNCRWNFIYGFRSKQKPCSVTSEESVRNKETPSKTNKSVEKQASEETDKLENQSPKKKSSYTYLVCPCPSLWRPCC